MSEATVTIRLSPSQFDLIRHCVQDVEDAALEQMKDPDEDVKVRHDARELAGRLDDLKFILNR